MLARIAIKDKYGWVNSEASYSAKLYELKFWSKEFKYSTEDIKASTENQQPKTSNDKKRSIKYKNIEVFYYKDENGLYKSENEKTTKLLDDKIDDMFIYNDKIYYKIYEPDEFKQIDINGENPKMIFEGYGNIFFEGFIDKSLIFVYLTHDSGWDLAYVYKINLDSFEKVLLYFEKVSYDVGSAEEVLQECIKISYMFLIIPKHIL